MNIDFKLRKDVKSGAIKITDTEVSLRSLKLGVLSHDEAEFLCELGSDIYILSLYQPSIFDGLRKATHKLYKAKKVKRTITPSHPVDPFFEARIVELMFSELFPILPKELDQKSAQSSMANVGVIGKTAFYLDECNAIKLVEYCMDRAVEKVNRSESLTYDQFFDMMQRLRGLTEYMPSEKKQLFGLTKDEEDDAGETE